MQICDFSYKAEKSDRYICKKELFKNTYFYNYDELEVDGVGLSMREMKEVILNYLISDESQICPLTFHNYKQYDALIEKAGGIDLMVIGLGEDGHFSGNMPNMKRLDNPTHKVFKKPNEPWYGNLCKELKITDFDYFVAMGVESIFKVKKIIVVAFGENKAIAVHDLLTKPISTAYPSTILRLHPNMVLLIDKDATAKESS